MIEKERKTQEFQTRVIHIKEQFQGFDFLVSRASGEFLRNLILDFINSGKKVVLDFQGIKGVAHSFADEVFGLLFLKIGMDKIREFLSFENTSEKIKNLAKFVIYDRMQRQNS